MQDSACYFQKKKSVWRALCFNMHWVKVILLYLFLNILEIHDLGLFFSVCSSAYLKIYILYGYHHHIPFTLLIFILKNYRYVTWRYLWETYLNKQMHFVFFPLISWIHKSRRDLRRLTGRAINQRLVLDKSFCFWQRLVK